MSRRPPNPAAERAAKNQQTIKSLLKLESNKVCADCKRNKHPRWASWNLGVFICIRCSGIHRGMGTHISRVKSVDLDSWTDEQLQSILSWGNARSNKFWEAKLAVGHVPSEAKIENFIRTKYELKRWVMDGPMPDPSTLDVEGDDDIPLSVVKEKQNLERRESVRMASAGQSSASGPADLIGGDSVPPRANTAGPIAGRVPPKAEPAPPKTTSTKDSLLGLDFFGPQPTAPPRPASATGMQGSGGQSRPDLKQSILSLYASSPRPQAQNAAGNASAGSFGGPTTGMGQVSSFGGLNDAFSSLGFGNVGTPKSPPNPMDAFSSFGQVAANSSTAQSKSPVQSDFSALGGGTFFDTKPSPSVPTHQAKSVTDSLGSFGGLVSPSAGPTPSPKQPPTSSALGDLFNFATSAPAPPTKSTVPSPAPTKSVFNLSAQAPQPAPANNPPTTSIPPMASGNLSGTDVWGGNVWGASDAKKSSEDVKPAAASGTNDFGWGAPVSPPTGKSIGGNSLTGNSLASQPIVLGASGAPKVAPDEEFGGWSSSTGPAGGVSKPAGGFVASEDLFSNVWQ